MEETGVAEERRRGSEFYAKKKNLQNTHSRNDGFNSFASIFANGRHVS